MRTSLFFLSPPNDYGVDPLIQKELKLLAKQPPIGNLAAGFRSSNKLNDNFNQIKEAFDNTLSRDGSGPNQMEAPLDMNSERILNLPRPLDDTEPARLVDLRTVSIDLIPDEIVDLALGAGAEAGTESGTIAATNVVALKADVTGANISNKAVFRTNILSAPANKIAFAADYGVVANGITDDTNALKNAIAAATDIQGLSTVILPVGVIRVTETMFLTRGNFSLAGQGSGATILRVDADNTGGLFVRSATSGGVLSNLTISSLTIDVVSGRSTTVSGVGLYSERIVGLCLTDVKASGFHTDMTLAGCFDVVASGCTALGGNTAPNGRVGLYITISTPAYGSAYGGNLKFAGCEFRTATGISGTPGYDSPFKLDGVDGVFFDSCYFGYGAISAIDLVKNGAFIAGVKFSNCWFDASAGTNIRCLNAGTPNGPITFTGCHWVGGPSVERNFVAVGDWTDITITGGAMQWANSDNMYFGATQRVNISGILVSLADADNAGGGEGINLQGCSDVTITGVIMDGQNKTDNGILVNDGSGVVITGNRIKGCINPITTSGTLNNYIIRSNGISGNTSASVIDGASGVNKSVGDNV